MALRRDDKGTVGKAAVAAQHRGNEALLLHEQLAGRRLYISSQVRFLVAAGIVGWALFARGVLGIAELDVAKLVMLAVFLGIFNVGIFLYSHRHRITECWAPEHRRLTEVMHLSIAMDFVFLTVAVWLAGGAKSPFLGFFLLYVILVAAFLPLRAACAHALLGYALLSGLLFGQWRGFISLHLPVGVVNSAQPLDGRYLFTVLAVQGILMGLGIYLLTTRRRLISQQMLLSKEVRQRKQAEEEYKTVLRAAMDGFWVVDAKGRILDVNDAYCSFIGYTREELLKMGIQDVEAVETPKEVAAHIETMRAKGMDRFETRHRRKDGTVIDVEVSINLLAATVDRQYVFLRDITERKRAEESLAEQRMNMIESARLSSLGTMAGSVAHEINNPLAVIAGCAEQLEGLVTGAEASPDAIKRLAEMVRRNSARILTIVQGLRNLSRDGSSDPFTATPVADIVMSVLELCQERFRVHGVHIQTPSPVPPLSIECRASQISQVLLNLLNNSFQAVEQLPEKWVRLDVADLGAQVEISVVDSGKGVSSEIVDHLFTPFFTTKLEQHGLGLGLSISRALAETHRGEIAFDPTYINTRFVLRLPKHRMVQETGKH